MDALQHSAATLQKWCAEKALPIWAERGQKSDGSWVEHLHLNGHPDSAAERRWRVLARQVYVYAKASQLGWTDGTAIALSTYETMKHVGFVHRVSPSGDITNPMRDLYDHAFYILAASSLYALTEEQKYLDDANDLLSWIDTELSHPKGGWRESDTVDIHAARRQNPHMHLFEASLFLYGSTKNKTHLHFAKKIFKFFENSFFDADTVSEFFESNWKLTPGAKGQIVEPGHAMEWVWLLGQYEKATGHSVGAYQASLYNKALFQRGWFLNDEEDKSGKIHRETKRLWVQTEVIKAHLAMAEKNVPGAREMAAATIDALFPIYLTEDGLWNDQINACNANIASTIPVSTFYHILCMAAEADRVAKSA